MEPLNEVLLAYAEPFLDVDGGMDDEELEEALEVASAIWNATVLDARTGGGEHLRELRVAYEADGWPPSQVIDDFVDRKRDAFPLDLRLIEHLSVSTRSGAIVLEAAETRAW
jgi:hypothetical protein